MKEIKNLVKVAWYEYSNYKPDAFGYIPENAFKKGAMRYDRIKESGEPYAGYQVYYTVDDDGEVDNSDFSVSSTSRRWVECVEEPALMHGWGYAHPQGGMSSCRAPQEYFIGQTGKKRYLTRF